MSNTNHPFWVIVNKEIADYVRSWRFIILIAIIALTCMGSLYTALSNIREAIKPNDPDSAFLFLKLFTVSDGTLPSFVVFISFLGPLLGIALGARWQECYATQNALWLIGISFDSDAKSDVLKETDRSN